jgi:hypothetical protein
MPQPVTKTHSIIVTAVAAMPQLGPGQVENPANVCSNRRGEGMPGQNPLKFSERLVIIVPTRKGNQMGSYLYRVFGKEFDVIIDGQPRRARMAKFWMKPHWDAFEDALRGRCSSWASDWDRGTFRSYCLQLGKLNASPAVSVFVLSQHDEDKTPGPAKRPDEGDQVLVFTREKHYVVDDPNFEGATILNLRRAGGAWEATKEKIVEPAKVP